MVAEAMSVKVADRKDRAPDTNSSLPYLVEPRTRLHQPLSAHDNNPGTTHYQGSYLWGHGF